MKNNINMKMPDEYVDMNETDKALEASGPAVTSIKKTLSESGKTMTFTINFDDGAHNTIDAYHIHTEKGCFCDTVMVGINGTKYDPAGNVYYRDSWDENVEVLNSRGDIALGVCIGIGIADVGFGIAAACGAFN